LNILVVEDNPADVFFFKEALEAAEVSADVYDVADGEDAIRYLCHRPPYVNAPRPDVLVLDLNLPFKSGREVIRDMAANPDLRSIPIAVLTTSASEDTICDTYPGPCLYFTKTADFRLLQGIIRQIAKYAHTVH
jgi:CheY-like chemotaxis protein